MIFASISLYGILFLAILILIGAILLAGLASIISINRLQCFLLHTLSIFLIGYFLLPLGLNDYINVLVFALFVTFLSGAYRFVLFKDKWNWKIRGQWLGINLFTLFVVQILFDVLSVTNTLVQLFFAAFCLTLVGVYVHPSFKRQRKKVYRHKRNVPSQRRRRVVRRRR